MEELKLSVVKYNISTQFPVITTSQQGNQILMEILSNDKAVIGVDIEAAVEMSRFGILCLLQVNKVLNKR